MKEVKIDYLQKLSGEDPKPTIFERRFLRLCNLFQKDLMDSERNWNFLN